MNGFSASNCLKQASVNVVRHRRLPCPSGGSAWDSSLRIYRHVAIKITTSSAKSKKKSGVVEMLLPVVLFWKVLSEMLEALAKAGSTNVRAVCRGNAPPST